MVAERVDAALEPMVIVILGGVVLLAFAVGVTIAVNSIVRRRRQRAHDKLSRSRRSDGGYDLFAKRQSARRERES